MSENPECFKAVESFSCGVDWDYYDDLKQKDVHFTFNPTSEEKKHWVRVGFKKLPHLLMYLKKANGSLENFELFFFRGEYPKNYYAKQEKNKNIISVNIDQYIEYGR